jgi:glycine/D-amino acid oxidase-like deaminating enzyme
VLPTTVPPTTVLPTTVVVGAGILGCLIARELAAGDPAAAVTLLDRDQAGAGATRRSAGLHLPRGATPRVRAMSAYSQAWYARLRQEQPGVPVYPLAATVIATPGPDGAPGGGYLDGSLAPGDAPPGLRVPAGCRAWRLAGAQYADVYQLTQVIAAGLRAPGPRSGPGPRRVRVAEGTAVTGLAADDAGVTVTTRTGERLRAGRVVLAPGPWLAGPAWRELLAPLGLRVKKVVALHLALPPEPDATAVVLDDEDAFLLPLAHRGHWLFSFTSRDWDVTPDALDGSLTPADAGAALDCLRRYSPALAAAAAAAGGRVFCDAYSPDHEPVVRALDPARRIIFAGAANGSGYRLAPAIAVRAAELAGFPPTGNEGVTGDHEYV